jgi:hypothetical protein
MADALSLYWCWSRGHTARAVEAATGLEARKAYARFKGFTDTHEVMSRRADLVDANWRKLTGTP